LASGNPGIYNISTLRSWEKLFSLSPLLTPTQRHDPLKQKYIKNKLSQCRAACVIWRSTRHSGGRALIKNDHEKKGTHLSHHRAAAAAAALLSSMNFVTHRHKRKVSGLLLDVHHQNIFRVLLMRHFIRHVQKMSNFHRLIVYAK
jgi:hypothetical protein